jgi:nucleoside-diphosphate-sugar epimerase
MKIALTGGTGFIGGALGKKLTDLGHKLIVFIRRTESAQADLCYPCEVFPWSGVGLPPTDARDGWSVSCGSKRGGGNF